SEGKREKEKSKKQKAEGRRHKPPTTNARRRIARRLPVFCLLLTAYCLMVAVSVCAQVATYEGRPISAVEIAFEGTPADAGAEAELQAIIKVTAGEPYSAVRLRQSLQDLFASDRVAAARVEVIEVQSPSGPVRVRFVIRRQPVIAGIRFVLGETTGTPIARDELRARLNLLEPGRRYSVAAIDRNADEIQAYLRDHGYYNATVEHTEDPDPSDASGIRRRVIFTITPGEPARVASFTINIPGFNQEAIRPALKLQPDALFTRDALGDDLTRIRHALIAQTYLAPTLNDPRVGFEKDANKINITLEGEVGPHVTVGFRNYTLKEKQQQQLLPVKREGNIDYSVLEEGARRVRNKLQEQGYFFSEVTPICTVTPPSKGTVNNGTQDTCQNLNPIDLNGHTVNIVYDVELRRRLKLTDIRITGTNKLTYDDVAEELRSQKASSAGFIPFLGGYGRGVTSNGKLQQDVRTIEAHMRDFGYRHARVTVLQGISPNEDNLIITFNVEEGPLTRVADIQFRAETVFTEDELRKQIQTIKDAPYSPSQTRADTDRLLNLYAREGFIEADLQASIDDLPKKGEDEQVRLVFTVTKEGAKAIVNDI